MHVNARTEAPPHPTLMLDHPGWLIDPSGSARRTFRSGDWLRTAIYRPHNNGSAPQLTLESPDEVPTDHLHLRETTFDPATLPPLLRDAHPFRGAVPLRRIPNPDLWDAFLYPILRHRVRVSDAVKQYRELCEEHGNRVDTTAGPTYIAPGPRNLLTLINARMIEREVRGRLKVLREVAQAYLTQADSWRNLSAVELFADLQSVRHIGKWTAGAIVADVTNDFSFYSFSGEPAHGRWRQLFIAMETDLPERDFENLRPELDRNQLSTLVALLLASKTSNGA